MVTDEEEAGEVTGPAAGRSPSRCPECPSCGLLYGFGPRETACENVRGTETPVSALIGSPYRRLKY